MKGLHRTQLNHITYDGVVLHKLSQGTDKVLPLSYLPLLGFHYSPTDSFIEESAKDYLHAYTF